MSSPMSADMSWLRVLEHHAARTPDKPLATFEGRSVTYGEMVGWSGRIAAGLSERGVGSGDVVGLLSYNSIEFLATIYAANHLGAIAMPINWRLAPAEVRFLLEHSQAKALVCDEALIDLADEATANLDSELAKVCVSAPISMTAGRDSSTSKRESIPERATVSGDHLHRLMYTSGTTGRPKGVMLTHANLAWKNFAHITEFGFTSSDVGLACGPLYHVGALDLITTTMIAVGRDHGHPPHVRRRDGGRRDRALEGDRGVDGAGDDPGGARPAGHRDTRPVVGAGDHRRRREAPDPVHRAAAAHLPVGLARRRVRAHRDRLRRHVPRPSRT